MNTNKIRFICYIFFALALMSWYPIQIPTRINLEEKKFLSADLYSIDTLKAKPVILIQTPYDKLQFRILEAIGYNIPTVFDTINYNFVVMDWRGFYSNKSKDSALYNRGLDGFDAVEWISHQNWCNGKVATWGGSALAEIQFRTAFENPPHLVCSYPYIYDYKTKYSDFYYGGALRKEYVKSLQRLGFLTLSLITNHPKYDSFWNAVEKETDNPDKINVPMLLATGWFDNFPGDVIRAFEDIQKSSASSVRNKHKLIVGPWTHMGFDSKEQGIWEFIGADNYADKIAKEFFDYYMLNAANGYGARPSSYFYEMGSDEWYTYLNWSSYPRDYDTLYLNENGRLLKTPPPPKMSPLAEPPDTIIYKPHDPSPSFGGARFNPFDFTIMTGPQDIASIVESRNDVSIYTSEMDEEAFSVNGSIKAEFFVGSDRKDTDFGIRLCLVTLDKNSIILTQGIKRARFRDGVDKESFMVKDSIFKLTIELEPLSIRLNRGEQLRIDITSSNYPMFDINLNNGGDLYKPGDTLIATNFIYRRSDLTSRIIIPVKKLFTNVFESKSFNDDLTVYPNPSRGSITVKSKSTDIVQTKIINMTGKILVETKSAGFLDISGLENGLYLVVCLLKNGNINTQKLIINK